MATSTAGVRERVFTDFSTLPPEVRGTHRHWLARAQNFWLEWIAFGDASAAPVVESECEMLLIAAHGVLHVSAEAPGGATADVPPHAVAILPPGRYAVAGAASAACALIASQRGDLAGRRVLNAAAYETPDARIVPAGRSYRRTARPGRIQVLDIDTIMASRDRPRLKMLQTETLSINIVEYEGPRDRTALSPHAHAGFEQGSLAIAGDFVHHLRVPWSSDAGQWRDDEHLGAPSPSLLIVPVEMIHTTEGVGRGHHFLVDVFSPPRHDFIDNGWVFNAPDYVRVD